MSETSQIVIVSNNPRLFNLIKDIIPEECTLNTCNDCDELFRQLIRQPEHYTSIIISPTKDNRNLLQQISNCSKTKTIPIIMELSPKITIEEINFYIRLGARYYLPETLELETVKTILLATVTDRKRYLSIEHDISADRSALLLVNAEFKFQLLEDCQNVANLIANACPNPKLAVIGITEILINAVEHGNLGISYAEKTKLQATANWAEEVTRRMHLPENKNKYVTVVFQKNNNYIKLYIKDNGNGFEWNKFQDLDSTRIYDSHGRGIIMAKNLAFERLEYLNKGNEINCYINLSSI